MVGLMSTLFPSCHAASCKIIKMEDGARARAVRRIQNVLRVSVMHKLYTWASATHRAFTFACVGAAMANETWKFVQAKSKQAMKQVLGIKNDAARMKVTPPLAVAPLAQEDDMRWNPNDDGINMYP